MTDMPYDPDIEVTPAEIKALNEQRASTYEFIARLYRTEVDSQLLGQLQAMRFPRSTGNEEVDEGYRLLASYVARVWDGTEIELAADYVRVFIGHSAASHSAAYPYESVYTSPKHLLMQDARDEVLAIYRSAGIDKQDSWKEGEDHVALELEFMAVLARRAVLAFELDDEAGYTSLLKTQKNFLEDHLLTWVPLLVKDVLKFSKTDFYRGLAHLTSGFLQMDSLFLEEMLEGE